MPQYAQVYWPGYLAPIRKSSMVYLIGWKPESGLYCIGSHVSVDRRYLLPDLLEDASRLEDLATKVAPKVVGVCYAGELNEQKILECSKEVR